MMISTFIVTIWQVRQNNMSPRVTINHLKGKFVQKKRQLTYIFSDKMENFLPQEICEMKRSDL